MTVAAETDPAESVAGQQCDVELSIVLPCLNEAETLATCVRKARGSISRLGLDGEVLVADNGSTDGSQQIALAEGARVVPIQRPGYGAALRGGIAAARGRYVLMADADDSYALDDIEPFVRELRAGADVVVGNRFQGGIEKGAMPFLHRRLGNPLLSLLGRVFFRVPIGDFHCGMRAFRSDRIRALGMRTDGMEFASEMIVRASVNKLNIVEVPTTLRPDGRSRPPHLRTWRDGWRHLRFLLAFSPRWLLLYPALVLIVLGLTGVTLLAFGPRTVGPVSFSIQSMLACATAVVVGMQSLGLAIIARAYATQLQLLPTSPSVERALERFTLERGIAVGGVLFVGGVTAFVAALANWGAKGFGELDAMTTMRLPILGMVLIVGGLQLIMVSFTLSLTTIGEY